MDRNSNLIYFNTNRTTQQDKAVTELMQTHNKQPGGLDPNVSKKALEQLAGLLNASPTELLFTRGTSESIRLAIRACFELNKHKGKHIVTNVTEHFVVLDCCKELEQEGAEISFLPVDREGLIDPVDLRRALRSDTILVCLMAANNETGVIQPAEAFSEICTEKGITFFCDASQYVGKLRCDVKELGISSLAFGAHKMHGPEGIGLLYISEQHKPLAEYIRKTYRPLLSSAQIAGFGLVAELGAQTLWENGAQISRLKAYLEHQLLDLEGLRINGSTRHRLYNTSNLTFPDPQKLIALQERFVFGDNLKKPSHVLQAMGLSQEENQRSFRFSFGKYNTLEEVKLLVEGILGDLAVVRY